MAKLSDAKTLSDSDPKSLNSMEYFVLRSSRIRSPEEHICRFQILNLLPQKPAASADENALVNRR